MDPKKYGVSFSIKQCRNFGIDPHETLQWLLDQGWRRFRLMSYWNEHEKHPGEYDFTELDWQIEAITKAGGVVSMCLGAKQPRWPEYHWPDWAWSAIKPVRDEALLRYIEHVVSRYKDVAAIVSWQLENEALLRGFGSRIEIDRARLNKEFALVRSLDPERPIMMSTSNGWGMPLRRPFPDSVGFSCYFRLYSHGRYHTTMQRPWLHRLRKSLIHVLIGKWVFVHELQCEPWGPQPIWKMDIAEQHKSMSPEHIRRNIAAAQKIQAYPIDLWGAEWWYWRALQGDREYVAAVEESIK